MVGNGESLEFRHGMLAFFNFGIIELFHTAAIEADQMVMVLAFIELVHCLAALKVAAG